MKTGNEKMILLAGRGSSRQTLSGSNIYILPHQLTKCKRFFHKFSIFFICQSGVCCCGEHKAACRQRFPLPPIFRQQLPVNLNHLAVAFIFLLQALKFLFGYPQEKLSDNSLRDKEGVSPEEVERLAAFYKKAGYQFIQGSDYMYRIQADTLLGWLDELCMENRGDGV